MNGGCTIYKKKVGNRLIRWEIGEAVEIISENERMQELIVKLRDGSNARAVHDADTMPPVRTGDVLLLNTTAVHLNLGSGGVHFVHANLSESADRLHEHAQRFQYEKGHIMKLKYTSLQRRVLAAEEEESGFQDVFDKDCHLERAPVLIGELHSMLPAAALWLHRHKSIEGDDGVRKKLPRIAYIMSDGGALPLAWSRHVRVLQQQLGIVTGTVTYGQAYGGDLEAVNKFTALLAAKHILKADIIIAAMGPGIAGTGTVLGHSAMEVGEIINAAAILQGTPIIMPRVSFADERKRHYGISHHTLTHLSLTALRPAIVPFPAQIPDKYIQLLRQQLQAASVFVKHDVRFASGVDLHEIADLFDAYPIPITTMGRTVREDPYFFLSVCTAAQAAENIWTELSENQQV